MKQNRPINRDNLIHNLENILTATKGLYSPWSVSVPCEEVCKDLMGEAKINSKKISFEKKEWIKKISITNCFVEQPKDQSIGVSPNNDRNFFVLYIDNEFFLCKPENIVYDYLKYGVFSIKEAKHIKKEEINEVEIFLKDEKKNINNSLTKAELTDFVAELVSYLSNNKYDSFLSIEKNGLTFFEKNDGYKVFVFRNINADQKLIFEVDKYGLKELSEPKEREKYITEDNEQTLQINNKSSSVGYNFCSCFSSLFGK